MYSKELMEIMKSYLDSIDLNYDFNEKKGEFTFCFSPDDESKEEMYIISIMPHSYLITFGFTNISVDDSIFNEVSEYLNRVNAYMAYIHFSVCENCITGTRRLNCNNIVPDLVLVEKYLEETRTPIKQFGQGIIDITDGKGTAKDIFEKYKREVR